MKLRGYDSWKTTDSAREEAERLDEAIESCMEEGYTYEEAYELVTDPNPEP